MILFSYFIHFAIIQIINAKVKEIKCLKPTLEARVKSAVVVHFVNFAELESSFKANLQLA